MSLVGQLRIDVYLAPEDRIGALGADVLRGLTSTPKQLPAKWFYDDRGSALFEDITRLPEYYLTRREQSILRARAGEIAELSRANTLVELGSGSSEKTRLLLDAMTEAGHLRRYVPFDVSEQFLRESAARVAAEYPGLEVHGVAGDFERHLGLLPEGRRLLFAFLGSSLGNLVGAERTMFLDDLRGTLVEGEWLLLGTDLVKDVARLEAAYDDAAGVTAEFNKNVLGVVNRELGGDFDLDRFEHVARFDLEHEWIDIRVRSLADQIVTVRDLELVVEFGAGEEMHTEFSDKFRREGIEQELAASGFTVRRSWTDPAGDFLLSLSEAV